MTIFALHRTSPTSPNTTLFPTLPLELREMIYHHAFLPHISPTHPHRVMISASDAVYNTDPRYPVYLPHLCRVSKSTRTEVGLWYIRNTEFGMLWPQYLVYLSQFLATFPSNSGFADVRRLNFEAFGRHTPVAIRGVRKNQYIEFMKKCEGLLHVKIKFEIWHLLKRYPMVPAPVPADVRELYRLPSVDEIVATYALQGLFELQNLRTLHVELWPKAFPPSIRGFFEYVPDCWTVMEHLLEWLSRELEDREMKVDIKLVESANPGMRWAIGKMGETEDS